MLNCESCDYFKKIIINGEDEKYICEFTNFIFADNFQCNEMNEPPCYTEEVNVKNSCV